MGVDTPRLSETDRRIMVGSFYEKLARALLGGTSVPAWEPGGDISLDLNNLPSFIEVKASNNRDPASIRVSQLDRHLSLMPFPFSRCLYLIGSYQNHATREKRTKCRGHLPGQPQRLLTNKSYTEDKLNAFLRAQTDLVCLLDARVIDRLRAPRYRGERRVRRFDGDEFLFLGKRWLRRLATGELQRLRCSRFAIRDYPRVSLNGPFTGTSFRLLLALEPPLIAAVDQLLATRHGVTLS